MTRRSMHVNRYEEESIDDLLMALRHTEASSCTLFDTPAFTGLAMSMREALDALG